MKPCPLGGTRPRFIDEIVAAAVPRAGSMRPKFTASIAAASSQLVFAASASVLWPIVRSGARSDARIASRAFCPAARYFDDEAESPTCVASFDAAQRPLAAEIVVYAKCFCFPFQCVSQID